MASIVRSAVCALVLLRADGHGVLTKPISRSLYLLTNETDGLQFAGECPDGTACQWYTQRTVVPGATTNCNETLRTMGVNCGDENPTDFTCTEGASVPWCAPGSAPVASACGIYSGGLQFGASGGTNGRDMRDLPPAPITDVWVAGTSAQVAWAITANHGGGYAYRLCPLGSSEGALSEECFQSGHLKFSGDTQSIVDPSGDVIATAPLVSTTVGTVPAGSQWARNPFPMEEGVIDPIAGLPTVFGRGPFNMSVVDLVDVPSDLEPGRYVLSWRWDAEQTKQVWSQCSDVLVVSVQEDEQEEQVGGFGALRGGDKLGVGPGGVRGVRGASSPPRDAAAASHFANPHKKWKRQQQQKQLPGSSSSGNSGGGGHEEDGHDDDELLPSGAKHLCTAESLGLDVGDCDAWVALYDAFGGDAWPGTWREGCGVDPSTGESLMRTNPCGCNAFWQKNVVCSAKRDLKRITEIYLLGEEVVGTLGDTGSDGSGSADASSNFLGNFTALVALSLVGTSLQGSLPADLFEPTQLSSLEMVWLDHNPLLGGDIPSSLASLPSGQVSAFELHGSAFGGALPSGVAWADIPDCTLNGLVFACPLPEGAETCGASCA